MDYFCFYSPPDQQNISKTEKTRKQNLGFKKCRFRLTQPLINIPTEMYGLDPRFNSCLSFWYLCARVSPMNRYANVTR